MPSFKFDKFLGVTIKSHSRPLSGQKNRSSDNYDFRTLKRAKGLKWSCPPDITFNVMEDKTAAIDPVTFNNISNGNTTKFPSDSACNGLYIANPKYKGREIDKDYEFEISVEITDNI